MGRVKAPHYRGSYHCTSAKLRAQWYADPGTLCARCGRTLAEHPLTRTGKRQWWTAGHVIDGQVGGALQPEAVCCGTRYAQLKRRQRDQQLDWLPVFSDAPPK